MPTSRAHGEPRALSSRMFGLAGWLGMPVTLSRMESPTRSAFSSSGLKHGGGLHREG